jgi:hypothetical protein
MNSFFAAMTIAVLAMMAGEAAAATHHESHPKATEHVVKSPAKSAPKSAAKTSTAKAAPKAATKTRAKAAPAKAETHAAKVQAKHAGRHAEPVAKAAHGHPSHASARIAEEEHPRHGRHGHRHRAELAAREAEAPARRSAPPEPVHHAAAVTSAAPPRVMATIPAVVPGQAAPQVRQEAPPPRAISALPPAVPAAAVPPIRPEAPRAEVRPSANAAAGVIGATVGAAAAVPETSLPLGSQTTPQARPSRGVARAYAMDGATFYQNGRKIRVQGLDASDPGMSSEHATQRLQRALDGGNLTVDPVETDSAGHTVSVVRVNGRNIADSVRAPAN